MVKCLFTNLVIFGSSAVAVTLISDIVPDWSKELLDIQATIECRCTVKNVRDRIRTCSQMHHTDKYSQPCSIIWLFWEKV